MCVCACLLFLFMLFLKRKETQRKEVQAPRNVEQNKSARKKRGKSKSSGSFVIIREWIAEKSAVFCVAFFLILCFTFFFQFFVVFLLVQSCTSWTLGSFTIHTENSNDYISLSRFGFSMPAAKLNDFLECVSRLLKLFPPYVANRFLYS